MNRIVVDIKELYGDQAKLSLLGNYIVAAKEKAGEGNVIILSGPGPVWLYLAVAHALHGVAAKLIYDSPATGEVVIFDHNPF